MIKMIFRLLLKKKSAALHKNLVYPQLKIDRTSRLLDNSNLDFRLPVEDRTYVSIGERCLINAKFTFETKSGEIYIGNNVHLGGVHFICKTRIEVQNDVTMAWGIVIYDHDSHSIYWEYRKNDNNQCYEDYLQHDGNNIINKDWSNINTKPIKIESKAWIGFDVLILKGVTIGEGAVVAAKSVVTKDVPAWSVVAGNPAKVVKVIDKPKG